jgi:septal ring factor EnvC (AmiA/AmiB activator)
MISEALDVNYVVGGALLAIVGLIRWVVVRLHKDMSTDRHALRNEMQALQSKLDVETARRESLQDQLRDLKGQIALKDREIVQLRGQVDRYTEIIIGMRGPRAGIAEEE